MAYYLDASTLVPLFLPDPHSATMQRWLRENDGGFFVSDFASAEFSSVVSRLVRMDQLAGRDANLVLSRFDTWRNSVPLVRPTNTSDIEACERLVRDFGLKLKVPDALHLALATADNLILVTFDKRLAQAARALKHPVVVPPK